MRAVSRPGARARCARQVFGRRQTFWDMIFGLLGARDKSLPVILLELVATVVVNFTAGLTVSVFAFLFQARLASWLRCAALCCGCGPAAALQSIGATDGLCTSC